MAKNDFDIDFDFEKEYGFDPKAILDSEYTDEDLDLSQFDEEALGIDLGGDADGEFEDFDLDALDLEEEPAAPVYEPPVQEPEEEELPFEQEPEMDLDELDDLDFEDEDEDYSDAEDQDMAFTRRASFFGVDTGVLPQEPMEEPDYELPQEEELVQEPVYEAEDDGQPEQELEEEPVQQPQKPAARRRRERPQKERKLVKPTMPPIFQTLVRLYIPNQQEIHARMEPADGRRRRRPSKQQIFKEYYLPPVILGLSLVLMFSFVIGALSNAIDHAQQKRQDEQLKAQQESIAAEQMATEGKLRMDEAERLAMGYDYEEAIKVLDGYPGEMSQEMTIRRAEYVNAKGSLVEYQDPTLIPNLSFHVLSADMRRSVADEKYGGQYNRNFVSTAEFEKILNQLYLNNFVLVDFDSFVASNSMDGSTEVFKEVSIWLPEGKKPVMITETMVNYFEYMIDSDKDGKADAGGAGFASRLVLDANGDIKAEYVDETGTTQVGNYDLVPILEDFIKAHPDFCYRGARATLAVCGEEGIFGYRIQTATQANRGKDFYDKEVVGATEIVNALRDKGYRLACYSYANKDYSQMSANMINEDLQKWKSEIAPVIGEVDTIVFARGTDIGDYTGGKFDVLRASNFDFMVKSGEAPFTEINNSYVRQTRLMVTGENMVAKASMFTGNGLFDPNTVLDLSIRGNVPTG